VNKSAFGGRGAEGYAHAKFASGAIGRLCAAARRRTLEWQRYCNINRERRNTMATKKTTHSKKLHKAKKIEQRKPLKGVDIQPFTITKQTDVSTPTLLK
jgi:hypothetical protein